jgi:hypothetical protein
MQRDEQEQFHQYFWKSQEEESMQLTVEDVCVRARMREKVSVRAYWIFLGFTALFAAAFVRNLIHFRDPWLIAGTARALAALCYISWRLIRNGPARIRPAETCVQFLRREFEGQRQSLLWIRWLSLLLFPAILGVVVGRRTGAWGKNHWNPVCLAAATSQRTCAFDRSGSGTRICLARIFETSAQG